MFDMDNDRMFVTETAIRHKLGTKEEIELYEELSLAMELMQDDSFRVESSKICNGIDFNIVTPYPDGLPVNLGSMFFNVSSSYSVSVKEVTLYSSGIRINPNEMNFSIKLKKC